MTKTLAVASPPYYMVAGDYKDELVAIHGPFGYIACGLRIDQAKPIIDELNHISNERTAQTPLPRP